MEKTVKIHAYSGDAKSDAAQGNPAEDKNASLELAMKDAQIEEEKSRSLEHLKTIVRLRESLKQEQAKTAEAEKRADELATRVKATAGLETNELANKNAQLEEEKNKSLENLNAIAQLRESLKQEQAKTVEMEKKAAEQESRIKELAVLEAKVKELPALEAKVKELAVLETRVKELSAMEAKVKELTDTLGKISSIAAAGKAG